jgi:hypothetical protein
MSVNVGSLDRVLRLVVGAALIVLALGYWPGVPAQLWAWIGLVPIATAIAGWCPAYTLLGVNTCGRASRG